MTPLTFFFVQLLGEIFLLIGRTAHKSFYWKLPWITLKKVSNSDSSLSCHLIREDAGRCSCICVLQTHWKHQVTPRAFTAEWKTQGKIKGCKHSMYDHAAGSDRNHLNGVHLKDPNRNKNTVQKYTQPWENMELQITLCIFHCGNKYYFTMNKKKSFTGASGPHWFMAWIVLSTAKHFLEIFHFRWCFLPPPHKSFLAFIYEKIFF